MLARIRIDPEDAARSKTDPDKAACVAHQDVTCLLYGDRGRRDDEIVRRNHGLLARQGVDPHHLVGALYELQGASIDYQHRATRTEGDPWTRRWTPTSLHRRWEAACRAVGLTLPISLYEGTKHTFATNAKRRGVEDRLLQRFLGHRDRRSVERYARLADEALIAVLRPLRRDHQVDQHPGSME